MRTHENSHLADVLDELAEMLALGESSAAHALSQLESDGLVDDQTQLVLVTEFNEHPSRPGEECWWGLLHDNGDLNDMWASPLLAHPF